MKSTKKTPTVEALAIASDNKISKSSWDRKLKNDRFLYILLGDIEKLIKRTQDEDKVDFYNDVHKTLSKKLEVSLDKKSKFKNLFHYGSKRKNDQSLENDNNDNTQFNSDRNQYNDWASENY